MLQAHQLGKRDKDFKMEGRHTEGVWAPGKRVLQPPGSQENRGLQPPGFPERRVLQPPDFPDKRVLQPPGVPDKKVLQPPGGTVWWTPRATGNSMMVLYDLYNLYDLYGGSL